KASGAKVIHYHHWADTAVPASNSIAYYDRVMKQMGDTSDYYKFYLVPGGFHGAPGVGATTLPWLDTIVNWVENGLEPDELVANRVKNDDVQFSRKICPYPSIAVYKGSGNNTSSDNFECSIER
ncbi:MAG: tannase/feruloyl esterase family alpha/beta hydrolase, partial [Kordiimonadaceae bacterium]|nr:tannase/feruloyl esterase family alpha/beta hydrolase [Kordiimonadaceae bacterium]